LRRDVRPIYERIGILPEVATAIQHSTELSIPPETWGMWWRTRGGKPPFLTCSCFCAMLDLRGDDIRPM